jgi:hypothetical protein
MAAQCQPTPLLCQRTVPPPLGVCENVVEGYWFGGPLTGGKAGNLEQVVNGVMQLLDPIVGLL